MMTHEISFDKITFAFLICNTFTYQTFANIIIIIFYLTYLYSNFSSYDAIFVVPIVKTTTKTI